MSGEDVNLIAETLKDSLANTFVSRFLRKYNSLSPVKVALAVCSVYLVFIAVMMFFHEPWTDEAQAWMIAKYASYREILFSVTHYEGHSPFLYLIYSIPAKLGLPFRYSIQILHMFSVAFMIGVLEFRLGLTNIVKTILPFTVFFVEYSVLARPYVLLIAAMLLALSMKNERNQKPVRYVLALGLLCCTHLYGVAIAGGIAISWLIDIFLTEKPFFNSIFASNPKRLVSLCTLLVFAIFDILAMLPADDCYSILGSWKNISAGKLLKSAVNIFLFLPSEMTVTDLGYNNYSLEGGLCKPLGIILLSVISLTIWALLFIRAKRTGTMRDVIPPLVCFISVAALYFYYHHYGIYLVLLVYCFIATRGKTKGKAGPVVLTIGIAAFFLMSVFWTGLYCYEEIASKCYPGKDLDGWIDGNGLRDYKWMTFCGHESPNMVSEPVISADAEYGKPLCSNYFLDRPYVSWIEISEEEKEKTFKDWGKSGAPDFIVSNSPLDTPLTLITNRLGVSDEYVPVYFGYYRYYGKGFCIETIVHVWMRKDLEDKINIKKDFGDYYKLVANGVSDVWGLASS